MIIEDENFRKVMIEVNEAVKYFNNCKPKHLRRFSEKTPEGNFIKGWICKKPNRYLGSLLIDELNGEPHEQFIQSMPKIEYFNDERDICLDSDVCGEFFTDAIAYEKLDGSCLITYPILDENGYIVEIVPKTRGRAVADSHFLNLYNKIDKSSLWEYYGKNKGILYFEMYGILNQHEIIHYQTGIDLVLIGCFVDGEFGKPHDLWRIAVWYNFNQPDELFTIRKNSIVISSRKYKWYFDSVFEEDKVAPTVIDAVDKIQSFLEWLNKTYNSINGRYVTEGVVINCTNQKGEQKYIKVKPRDIENKHRSENGIPRSSIVKEVLKYFDDYGSEVEEIYNENKNHHTEYITRMLLEDYPEEYVQKSSKKIEKIFMQIWDSKQVPESLHNIAQELYDEYHEKGITHCMRMFGQKYPMKKKYAKTIYQVLENLYARNNEDTNGT